MELSGRVKELDELKGIRQLYEDLHSTEQDRVHNEIQANFTKRIATEKRKVTLLGHLRQSGGQTGQSMIFSEVTSKYLDVTDLAKVLALSKPIRRTALKYNPGLFVGIHSNRIALLNFRLKEWIEMNSVLRRQVSQLEQREKARN